MIIFKEKEFAYNVNEKSNLVDVKENELFSVFCLSAFNKYITNELEFEDALNTNAHHPLSGGISLSSKKEHNAVCLFIHDINILDDVVWCLTRSSGALKSRYSNINRNAIDRHYRKIKITNKNEASLGFIGITTNDTRTSASGRAGRHGGNLDFPFIRKGCKVIIPKNGIDFPVLWLGDVHAKQGYGELSGVAYECSAHVVCKWSGVNVASSVKWPYVVYKENDIEYISFLFASYDETLDATIIQFVEYLISLSSSLGFSSYEDLYEYIGVYADLVCGQVTGKVKTIALKFVLRNDIFKSFDF